MSNQRHKNSFPRVLFSAFSFFKNKGNKAKFSQPWMKRSDVPPKKKKTQKDSTKDDLLTILERGHCIFTRGGDFDFSGKISIKISREKKFS